MEQPPLICTLHRARIAPPSVTLRDDYCQTARAAPALPEQEIIHQLTHSKQSRGERRGEEGTPSPLTSAPARLLKWSLSRGRLHRWVPATAWRRAEGNSSSKKQGAGAEAEVEMQNGTAL
ncbi:unnamed protein product [Lepidochelys kempii]